MSFLAHIQNHYQHGQVWWHIPTIPATEDAEIGGHGPRAGQMRQKLMTLYEPGASGSHL
jgi:hypothetical protein